MYIYNPCGLSTRLKLIVLRENQFARHQHDTNRTQNRATVYGYLPAQSSIGVVLMSCKINFHVVRSALQNFNVST